MTSEKCNAILSRMQRYCAMQDRSVQQIREKLYGMEELTEQEREYIIQRLLDDKFLDDARFVENYVRSKVNQKKWGRQKIRHGLYRHRIPDVMIDQGLEGIDIESYKANLLSLLITRKNKRNDRNGLIRYLLQRGYEFEEIENLLTQ